MPSVMKQVTITAITIAIMSALLFFGGCSTHQSKPGKSGYLKSTEQMARSKELPFYREWHDSDVNWKQFTKVYIAPVDTSHIEHMTWWQKASFDRDLQKGRNEAANYMHRQFEKAFSKNSNGHFTLVDQPGPGVLTIETAITELVPSKAWLNTVESLSIFVTTSKGTIAMESRIIDGSTGKTIATVADTKNGRTTVFSGADFSWWGHSKNAIDSWATDFEAVIAKGWNGRVKARSEFALITW